MSERPRCIRCFIAELGNADLTSEIREYIASLPAEICVSDDVYRRRLDICADCDGLREGCCRYCGCFAEVRAKKKTLCCPSPDGDRWSI